MSKSKMPTGWKKVQPGFYQEPDGALHINIPELLDLFGYEDTQENRDICADEAVKIVREMLPEVPLEVRE